jgi:hypothetical protein
VPKNAAMSAFNALNTPNIAANGLKARGVGTAFTFDGSSKK